MTKTSVFAALMVVAAAGAAEAGGQAGSIGVGAEFQIAGPGGASLNYDAGDFHVGGFLGFSDGDGDDDTVFQFGGRFFYHVHSTAMSDFGVGGNIGIVSFPSGVPMMDERDTAMFIEPALQIRLFLASNVAFSASTGVVIGVIDASGVAITGQTIGGNFGQLGFTGAAGLHYYFF